MEMKIPPDADPNYLFPDVNLVGWFNIKYEVSQNDSTYSHLQAETIIMFCTLYTLYSVQYTICGLA